MKGRRLQVQEGQTVLDVLEHPGDYVGPLDYPDRPGTSSVWFVTPIPLEEGEDPVDGRSRRITRVTQPPHTFRECPDGSLEIRASIAVYNSPEEQLWHGYLDEGHIWRTV